jgi:UDP-glucose:glycoprotein glucosyltransferase
MGHAKSDNSFEVIVRYRPVAARIEEVTDINRRRNSLKGYGVEMVLKKTDYLAVDDRDTGTVEGKD